VESNSLEVVNACSGNEMWWSEATSVFAECVTLVASIRQWSSNAAQEKPIKLMRLLGFAIRLKILVIGG
jgi:hypothetical protein